MSRNNYKNRMSEKVRVAIEKGDEASLISVLTTRQRLFCKEYVSDYNATKATIRAGYAIKNAEKQATLLTQHPAIQKYIELLSLSKAAKAVAINPDWVLQKTVNTISSAEDKANFAAVLRGLELLARHFGMLKDKQEISGPDGEAIRIQQEQIQKDAQDMKTLIDALTTRTFVITDGQE